MKITVTINRSRKRFKQKTLLFDNKQSKDMYNYTSYPSYAYIIMYISYKTYKTYHISVIQQKISMIYIKKDRWEKKIIFTLFCVDNQLQYLF